MAAFFSSVLFAVTILCFFRAMLTAESISLHDLICIEYGRPFLNLCLHPGHTLPFSITSTIIKQKLVKGFCIFLVSPLRLKKSGVLNVIARWHSGTWQYRVASRLTLFAFVVYLALYIIDSHLFFTDLSSFLPLPFFPPNYHAFRYRIDFQGWNRRSYDGIKKQWRKVSNFDTFINFAYYASYQGKRLETVLKCRTLDITCYQPLRKSYIGVFYGYGDWCRRRRCKSIIGNVSICVWILI